MRGKAYVALKLQIEYQDHPRLCGEKQRSIVQRARSPGSPPPMRGKVQEHIRYAKFARITPAYAGKSGK